MQTKPQDQHHKTAISDFGLLGKSNKFFCRL